MLGKESVNTNCSTTKLLIFLSTNTSIFFIHDADVSGLAVWYILMLFKYVKYKDTL